jgi:hypothetical protein
MLRVARRRSGVTLEEVCFEGEVVGSVESWIDESSLLIELERQPSGKTEDGERLVRAQLMSGRGG